MAPRQPDCAIMRPCRPCSSMSGRPFGKSGYRILGDMRGLTVENEMAPLNQGANLAGRRAPPRWTVTQQVPSDTSYPKTRVTSVRLKKEFEEKMNSKRCEIDARPDKSAMRLEALRPQPGLHGSPSDATGSRERAPPTSASARAEMTGSASSGRRRATESIVWGWCECAPPHHEDLMTQED